MPPVAEPSRGRDEHWRSLDELADSPRFRAFLEAEFPAAMDPEGVSRRRWLQLMGASLALAAATGCRYEQEQIMPLAQRPEGRVPGKPQFYNTAMDAAGRVLGLRVTCYDGRPVKIEGNPRHPQSLGATNVFAQAAILEMYDPDRSRHPVRRGEDGRPIVETWERTAAALRSLAAALRERGGEGLAVLAEPTSSPTVARLRGELLAAMPQARWYEYQPLDDDHAREGARQAFGVPCRTHFALERAEVIACLDADLLGDHPAAVPYARAFAAGRVPRDGAMNRLYAVESGVSLTGAAADERLPLRTDKIPALVAVLAEQIERRAGGASGGGSGASAASSLPGAAAKFVSALAEDLWAHRGRCAVAVGPRQPAAVHAAVHRIQSLLENVGRTVFYLPEERADRAVHVADLAELVERARGGEIQTLILLGGNPVYDAPADFDFSAALGKVPETIHLSLYRNETSQQASWHLPQAHFLESWGDARSWDGTYSVVQPTIAPLHGGRSAIEILAMLLGEVAPDGLEHVRRTFAAIAPDGDWRRTVHDGLLAGSASAPLELPAPGAVDVSPGAAPSEEGLELVFAADASVFDGRYANSGWLQELPDPLTKITWDNAALISPATARRFGLANQDVVRLAVGERSLEAPVFLMPGHADDAVTLALGYGRTAAGLVGGDAAQGVPPVGVDAYRLRTSTAMHAAWGVQLTPTGRRHRLATTQDHHAIDRVGQQGRERRLGKLVREATLEHYREHPDFAQHAVHHPPLLSLWEEHAYDGQRWGMAIDLSKCIGCNACVVACQAENNVPVVGKDQVLVGREMHWLRIDRYFRGGEENPAVAMQPVACHHCELAPCEQVCPVNATVHSSEGLNDMVYNRCVGTRYCANNCPYKVRRFNYFNLHEEMNQPRNEVKKMLFNPEVTVRSRGVMEKCTYCVQRIQAVKIAAKNERRAIRDGEVVTACQQACPAQAIVFGDLGPAELPRGASATEVRRQYDADRAYGMLAELNVKPRTHYLAKIRNPNPKLHPASAAGAQGEHDEHRRHSS